MRFPRLLPSRISVILAIFSLMACTSDLPSDPNDLDEGDLRIEVTGWLERGAVVTLTATDQDARTVQAEWSATPGNLVEFLPDGRLRLLKPGKVTLTAQAGEEIGRTEIEIKVPPTIVFEMLRDGARDIYRAALDGADLVRLTSGTSDNREPTVAGDRVVFVSYRHGNGELFSVPLAGGNETRLTTTAAHEAEPALSPDGKRLAFTSSATGVPKLWTAAGDAKNGARATTNFGFAGSIEAGPSWSPKGDRLVFVSTTKATSDLYIYTVSSGAITPLLDTDAPEVEPAWSPDGEWIAFASAREGQTDLYRIHIATRKVEQLTDRAETDARPAWLADGRIVYIARVDGVPRLRWLDPNDPSTVHEIPVGDGTIGRVAAVW